MTIRYIAAEIGIGLEPADRGTRKDRAEAKARNEARDALDAKFKCGRRLLILLDFRRLYCTVLDPFTLNYIADVRRDVIEDFPDVPDMTRIRWRRLALRMETRRRRQFGRSKEKQPRTIRAAEQACKRMMKGSSS